MVRGVTQPSQGNYGGAGGGSKATQQKHNKRQTPNTYVTLGCTFMDAVQLQPSKARETHVQWITLDLPRHNQDVTRTHK